MDALKIIEQEHANLWRLTSAIDTVAENIRQGDKVDKEFFRAVFDYLESFIDRAHHPKEDAYLFPLLRQRDLAAAGLIDRLIADHQNGATQLTELRKQLAVAVDDDKASAFADCLKAYTARQKEHIRVEEKELLPRARSLLTAADWHTIDAAFLANDDPLFGENARVEYRALFHRLVHLGPDSVGLGGHIANETTLMAAQDNVLLRVRGLESAYGRIKALKKVDLDVQRGEIVALVGANGAGKSTFLRTLSGVQPLSGGSIAFDGEDISKLRSDQRVRRGICHSPEGRQVFGPLSIEDNLRLGAYTQPNGQVDSDLSKIYTMFPILKEKRRLTAGTLSGGQQQMLAIGRALMGRPKLLLLDEPSMGLAPLLVEEVFNVVKMLKSQGITILLVEQNAFAALSIADRGYVMETGAVTLSGTGAKLLASDEVRAAYLGM